MAKINAGEYTWKDCKLNANENKGLSKTPSKETFLGEVGEILGGTISITGEYDLNIVSGTGEPYLAGIKLKDSDLRITCVPNDMLENEKDNWYLKIQSNGTEIQHQSTDDDVLTVTCKSNGPKTITEINLGEKTAHKVYNSYQWVNQATGQQESYWPYGCILTEKVNDTTNTVRMDYATAVAQLKRYSIPQFYTNNRSVSGYGWYQQASQDELLQEDAGYQTNTELSPFDTTRPKQMLFLSPQLRDPVCTVLYNGWIWNQPYSTPPTVRVDNNLVYLNEQMVYELAPGDLLVKYDLDDQAFFDYPRAKLQEKGPYRLGNKLSTDAPEDELAELLSPDRLAGGFSTSWLNTTSDLINYNQIRFSGTGEVQYEVELTPYTIFTYQDSTFQPLNKNNPWYDIFSGCITLHDWQYENTFTHSATSSYEIIYTITVTEDWECMWTEDFNYKLSVSIKNIPQFQVPTWLTGQADTTYLDWNVSKHWSIDCRAEARPTPIEHEIDLNIYLYAPDMLFNCALLEDINFPIIAPQYLHRGGVHVFTGDHYTTYFGSPGLGLYSNPMPTLHTNFPGYICSRTKAKHFETYVVWHLYPSKPDEITESTDNGGSVPNATPH